MKLSQRWFGISKFHKSINVLLAALLLALVAYFFYVGIKVTFTKTIPHYLNEEASKMQSDLDQYRAFHLKDF